MGGNEPANLGSLCGEKGLSPSRENSAESLSEERSPRSGGFCGNNPGPLVITAELLVCKRLQRLPASSLGDRASTPPPWAHFTDWDSGSCHTGAQARGFSCTVISVPVGLLGPAGVSEVVQLDSSLQA